jgi:phage major head subunit gpT-like protein
MQAQPANLDLLRRTTRADFYAQLAITEQEALYPQLTMPIDSDADQETYSFFGAPTKPVRTDIKSGAAGSGVSRSTPFRDYSMSLKNATWVWLQDVDRDIIEDAKLDQIKVRAQEAGAAGPAFQDERMSAVIEANGNSYDAVAFFSGSHHGTTAAAKDNDLTTADDSTALGSGRTGSGVTVTDAENVVALVIGRFRTFTDDQSRIANAGNLGIVWMVPPVHERVFRAVIEVGGIAGQTGNSSVFKGTGTVMVNPFLTNNTTIGYAFVTAKPIKPIVYQTRIPWEFKLITDGDDWEKRDIGAMKGRSRFDFMLGDWKKGIKWTFS